MLYLKKKKNILNFTALFKNNTAVQKYILKLYLSTLDMNHDW